MFMGEYHHNLDSKGRLIIPAKLREQIGDKMVFTRGMEGCIFGYSMDEWSKIEAKLAKLPLTKRDARKFMRLFYSGAELIALYASALNHVLGYSWDSPAPLFWYLMFR